MEVATSIQFEQGIIRLPILENNQQVQLHGNFGGISP